METVHEISAEEIKKLLDAKKDILIIDVRTAEERAEEKIDGTIHIPLDELSTRVNDFAKEKEIYFHCKSGKRSAIACTIFTQAGFSKVHNITGGIIALKKVL